MNSVDTGHKILDTCSATTNLLDRSGRPSFNISLLFLGFPFVVDGQEGDYKQEDARARDPAYNGISTTYVATSAKISATHQVTLLYGVT